MFGAPAVATSKVAASAVSQRLTDLLLQFPSAAISGVQWRVLVRKYEERHATRLDISALGYASPLAAASTLLWDVLRLVDTEDTDNPIVAIEDSVVLTPRPGSMGSWPSLYVALCDAVQSNGQLEEDGVVRSLLLSQLKPLLQTRWHANFDENGLGFLSEEGSYVKMKKMKHLVQAVLRWRDQRVESQSSKGSSGTVVDKVLIPSLELVASKKHNDLMLRYVSGPQCHQEETVTAVHMCESPVSSSSPHSSSPRTDVAHELAFLRAENAKLRSRNEMLVSEHTDMSESAGVLDYTIPENMVEVFDDPYEPPPQKFQWSTASVASASTGCSSPCLSRTMSWVHSGVATPASMTPTQLDMTGCMTPKAGLGDQMCALVPVWFSMMPTAFGDRCTIPTGIVQRFRSQIDAAESAPLVPPPRWDRK